jgi:hypothetical protein
MRRVWEVLLVLLGVALAFYVSDSIPRATIQRNAGAAVLALIASIVLVALWEKNHLSLRNPVVRHAHQTDTSTTPIPAPVPAKANRVYSDISPADLLALGSTPDLTDAERSRLLAPYVGKWLRMEVVVVNVSAEHGYVLVHGIGPEKDKPPVPPTFALFGTDLDRVSALRKGVRIHLGGKFQGLAALNFGLILGECELLS